MIFTGEMTFLGMVTKESKKTGNQYNLVKLMDMKTSDVYECYVPADRLKLITDVAGAKPLQKLCAHFEVSSFNGKMQVDLVKVEL